MPRRPRFVEPGRFFHVTTRGNNRAAVYFVAADRLDFFWRLERVSMRHKWTVFAYCLMTNHYHLVLRVSDAGLSQGMAELNGHFAQRVNRRHHRTGHLFQDRYHAQTIERDSHLLEACRYAVLNPVRAGMCKRPEDWSWSSYRPSAGLEAAPPFLAVDELLQLFRPEPRTARAAYHAFVESGLVLGARHLVQEWVDYET